MNEAEVRAEVIDKLLQKLGYRKDNIRREVPIDIQAGRGKPKRCFADYVISVDKKKFIIEAKSSKKSIVNKNVVAQAKSYALHLHAKYFAICNGKEFALYEPKDTKCVLSCGTRELKRIKEKISCGQLEPRKKKNIVENVIEGNFQRAEDQLFNILVRKAKKL